MRRVAIFLATVAVVLGGIGALDWWIDPFLDRYDPAPLAAALAQPRPCFVGWDVFSARAWPELKVDYFRRRDARIVVVGTSRAGKIGARPGERRFANLILPGTGPETLAPLFQRLHALGHGPLSGSERAGGHRPTSRGPTCGMPSTCSRLRRCTRRSTSSAGHQARSGTRARSARGGSTGGAASAS